MEQPIYLHEFQRPTLQQIVDEGCKKIDAVIEKLCSECEAPQLPVPDTYTAPGRSEKFHTSNRYNRMISGIANCIIQKLCHSE